jgi:hypothetical protein
MEALADGAVPPAEHEDHYYWQTPHRLPAARHL